MRAPSAACAECRTLLGGYVLDALEPDEMETVRAHLAVCEECAAEHAELATLPVLLEAAGADEAETEAPPAALEEAVLDRFAREHPAHRRRERRRRAVPRARALLDRISRPLPAALAGALAAAAITLGVFLLQSGAGTQSASAEGYQAWLTSSRAAPGATAFARLQTFSAGTRVRLHVRGLRGGPAAVYELWCLRDDGVKVSAGTFRVDAHGRADVSLTTAAVIGEYHRLSVERQPLPPAGGSPRPVLTGDIQYGHA